jgi:hypothetical protein
MVTQRRMKWQMTMNFEYERIWKKVVVGLFQVGIFFPNSNARCYQLRSEPHTFRIKVFEAVLHQLLRFRYRITLMWMPYKRNISYMCEHI